jgi:hypothetical protein
VFSCYKLYIYFTAHIILLFDATIIYHGSMKCRGFLIPKILETQKWLFVV